MKTARGFTARGGSNPSSSAIIHKWFSVNKDRKVSKDTFPTRCRVYAAVRLTKKNNLSLHGSVAQSVEQRTENPCVGGSIPSRATLIRKGKTSGRLVFFMFEILT